MDNLEQHVQTHIGLVAGDDLPGSILRPPTDRLKEEVGLDSLDAVELILNLQEAFDLAIPDKDAQQLKTVGDVVGKRGKPKYKFRQTSTEIRYLDDPPSEVEQGHNTQRSGWVKRSPLFMHKKHARLWLELTAVRVERVQDISEIDAIAEGCERFGITMERNAINTYKILWNTINGSQSWQQNPWVWCLSFKVVQP